MNRAAVRQLTPAGANGTVLLWQRALLVMDSSMRHIPPDIQPGSPSHGMCRKSSVAAEGCGGHRVPPQWGSSYSTSGSPLLQCAWQPPQQAEHLSSSGFLRRHMRRI